MAATRTAAARRGRVALGLQGGGAYGAFTSGVLERLLEDDGPAIDAVSGASAGAINAVLLADGLAAGGAEAAREALVRFWRRVGDLAPGGSAIGKLFAAEAANTVARLSSTILSPYQFNPLGLNPLRDILADAVDFARLRRSSPVRLLIALTRVRDGRLRLVREHEMTLEAVLASACLPHVHHAVEFEGEAYWDGGYSANPPLRQLPMVSGASDIVLVQIAPETREAIPRLAGDIAARVREITFATPLHKEIEALDDLRRLGTEAGPFRSRLSRRFSRLRLHHIVAPHVSDLRRSEAGNIDPGFLDRLRAQGAAAAAAFIATGVLEGQDPLASPDASRFDDDARPSAGP